MNEVKFWENLLDFPIYVFLFFCFIIPFWPAYKFSIRINNSILKKFFYSLAVSFIISFFLVLFFAYYADCLYYEILNSQFGYFYNGVDEFTNPEKLTEKQIKLLEEINRRKNTGIGWPLRAMFSYVYIIVPYNALAISAFLLIKYAYKRTKNQF